METKDVIDFGGYHTSDDNDENRIRITPVVSAGQMATPSIRTDNDLNFDIGSTYPITVSSASASSTVETSTCTTANNITASTGGRELLATRSRQEQHDYNQQGITPVVSAGQMATPSIGTDNNLNFEIGSTYPIEVSSASESSTVGSSTCTTENNITASTGGHELLVSRSPQEHHDYNQQGITPVLSTGQMATPSICTENDLNFDIGSTYPISLSSASESSTVPSSTHTTENNSSASTGGHELLVSRSPQEHQDYNQQGSSPILCHTFSQNLRIH